MSSVFLASYKAKNDTWLGKLIAWHTRPNFWKFWETGKYSHSEIVIGDPRVDKSAIWCSSHILYGGVVIRHINYSKKYWDIIELPNEKPNKVYQWFKDRRGMQYDKLGVFIGRLFKIKVEDPKKVYCSEAAVLSTSLKDEFTHHIDPNSLMARCVKLYGEVI